MTCKSQRLWMMAFFVLSTCAQVLAQVELKPSYSEPYRPAYHFTPSVNWMNDPNGLVYYQGEYHLFYQHNPLGIRWGHMSWGHAVSNDLVHWKHLPVALPETDDLMAFSGSVVVDKTDSAGFQSGPEPALVAVYTGYRPSDGWQAQFLAYSNDRGRTFQQFEGNPVLDIQSTDFRDPKVFRYENEWRMVIALPTERKVSFYSSKDLKEWAKLSDFGPEGAVGGAWECPDLFELPVENMPGESRWVLQVDLDRSARAGGSGGQYFVGHFDGTRFILDQAPPRQLPPEGEPIKVTWNLSGEGIEVNERGVKSDEKGTGRATSDSFLIDQSWLNFKLKGGRHPNDLVFRLLIDGETVAETTGYNGSIFQWQSWDVSQWRGREAQLQLEDSTGKLWGHLEIRDPQLSNRRAPHSVDQGQWMDYGPDFYACVSYNNLADQTVCLAWMNNWLYAEDLPTNPWRSAMTVPRSLSLKRLGDGIALIQQPIEQLGKLRKNETTREIDKLSGEKVFEAPTDSGELFLQIQRGNSKAVSLDIQGLNYEVDFEDKVLRFTRGPGQKDFHPKFPMTDTIPLRLEDDSFRARIFFDRSSVELFAEDGAVTVTARSFPLSSSPLRLRALGGESGPISLRSWQLSSVFTYPKE